MRSQEQAFRAYYASMTDAELLGIAANRVSFIQIAQNIQEAELKRRELSPAPGTAPPARHSGLWDWGHHLAERFHHSRHPVST